MVHVDSESPSDDGKVSQKEDAKLVRDRNSDEGSAAIATVTADNVVNHDHMVNKIVPVHYAVLDEVPVSLVEANPGNYHSLSGKDVVKQEKCDFTDSPSNAATVKDATDVEGNDSNHQETPKTMADGAVGGDSGIGSSCSSSNKSATPQVCLIFLRIVIQLC